MKVDYELNAAKARREALRAASGWRPPAIEQRPLPTPKPVKLKPDLWRISQRIMAEVGNCIPDGDPIDHLAPFIERLGFDRWDTTKWLDKACRAHLGCKSYNQYLVDAWDGWNEVCEEDQRMDNPWK